MISDKSITLAHGSGGLQTHKLIKELFLEYFGNESLNNLEDSAILKTGCENLVFTTDSHVVKPLFFPGGDIGKLAIAGTVNDLAVCGAIPRWISCAMIIEEGFSISDLEKIVISMKQTAEYAGVQIVTGDTKVVEKGNADGIYINTAGIGTRIEGVDLGIKNIQPGDAVIINGNIGDHGAAIITAREEFPITLDIKSDCHPLNKETIALLSKLDGIRIMRDPTRGGVATTLNEFTENQQFGIQIIEKSCPVRSAVSGLCEPLGFDPLYLANEGKFIVIVDPNEAQSVLKILQSFPSSSNATIIGNVVEKPQGKVVLETSIGSSRILDMLSGEMLPRIC